MRKPFELHATDTIGFWRNWDSHNTFTEAEIEDWLRQIDSASQWWGPTTVEGMEEMFGAATGRGNTPEERFLAQCLATHLNVQSGIFDAPDTHDISGADPGNYLGLARSDERQPRFDFRGD